MPVSSAMSKLFMLAVGKAGGVRPGRYTIPIYVCQSSAWPPNIAKITAGPCTLSTGNNEVAVGPS
jgi:hypothetical protein